MANKPFELNATAASLLGFLHERPMTGWDLVAVADSRIGNFWNLTKSQVYRELQSLADHGYVSSSQRGTRDRRTFTINKKGREIFKKWLYNQPSEEIIRFPLLLSASFADLMEPEVLPSFIATHRKIHAARLEQYKTERQKVLDAGEENNSGRLMTFAFGISYEEMVLRWMDEVRGVEG